MPQEWVATFESLDDFWDYIDSQDFEEVVSLIPEELTGKIVLTLEYVPDEEENGRED